LKFIKKSEFSKAQQEKIIQIISSKKNEKGFIAKEEVKKILKKSPPIDNHTFSSDNMSDIFDFITSAYGDNKNYIDVGILKEFAKQNGIEVNEQNEDQELKTMLTLTNKQNISGKVTKTEFLKLRNFLE